MSCNPCHQIRDDLTEALNAGKVVQALKIATEGAKVFVIKTAAPAVARHIKR